MLTRLEVDGFKNLVDLSMSKPVTFGIFSERAPIIVASLFVLRLK